MASGLEEGRRIQFVGGECLRVQPLCGNPIVQCYKNLKSRRFVEVVKKLGGMRMNCKVGLQGGINRTRLCGRKILVVVHSLEVIMSFERNHFSLE